MRLSPNSLAAQRNSRASKTELSTFTFPSHTCRDVFNTLNRLINICDRSSVCLAGELEFNQLLSAGIWYEPCL
jgi:hypothetical protein